MRSTDNDRLRFLCLFEELETSKELLKSGFAHLQEANVGRNFYHLSHLLLASGLERLMKCYILAIVKGRDGKYPDLNWMRDLGHDLESLLKTILTNYCGGTDRPRVRNDLEFIKSDDVLKDCVRILSLFGKKGRYYNLDVVAGKLDAPIDPEAEWRKMEFRVENPVRYLDDLESLYRDYYPRVNSVLIGRMERLVRAIAMQFTLGGHEDTGGVLRRLSDCYREFRNLRDESFGKVDYRVLQQTGV